MSDIRSCDPDRMMAAFTTSITTSTRDTAMETTKLRIAKQIDEARARHGQGTVTLDTTAVLDDLTTLLRHINLIEDENHRQNTRICELHAEVGTACEAGRADALSRHAVTIKKMATQITAAMSSLDAAGIKDVGGGVDTRLARRIDVLVAQRTSKTNAITLAVSNQDLLRAELDELGKLLDRSGVPRKNYLINRLQEVVAGWRSNLIREASNPVVSTIFTPDSAAPHNTNITSP